ncbi:Receptor expression-enhancing protein 2 [Phlyctema vagabunda]|uniref:Protein YOP1 n=1 Tax=Phlyctema vagabunda TaxID=108571 RepID=A0ABR4PBA3_9HELO
MFGTVATLLSAIHDGNNGLILWDSSIPTFLFPVFASYKALKTTDPALLTPWLMYWVVLACALLFESWVGFILVWIPFYAWIRLGFLLYLILPQTQGARVLYQLHVHPFLEDNEHAIDDFISSAHERAKAAGLTYLKQAIELIKQHVLGLPPKEATPPSTPTTFSYAQSLIARFNLPSARPSYPATPPAGNSSANDFYSLLASAVTAATSASINAATGKSPQNVDLSNSGSLIPPTVSGADRVTFIAAQRERLSILLSALDKEANNLEKSDTPKRSLSQMSLDDSQEDEERPKSSMSGLSKSRSEADFEKIDAESGAEEVEAEKRMSAKRTQSGSASWMPWSWGATGKPDEGPDTPMQGTNEAQGKSTGIDT